MTIENYIENNENFDGNIVLAYYKSGYWNSGYHGDEVWLWLGIDERRKDFDTEEQYNEHLKDVEVHKGLADELIEKAKNAYQCDSDSFNQMVNEIYIEPIVAGAADPDTIYRYLDYNKLRNDLLTNNYFYYGGYYFSR